MKLPKALLLISLLAGTGILALTVLSTTSTFDRRAFSSVHEKAVNILKGEKILYSLSWQGAQARRIYTNLKEGSRSHFPNSNPESLGGSSDDGIPHPQIRGRKLLSHSCSPQLPTLLSAKKSHNGTSKHKSSPCAPPDHTDPPSGSPISPQPPASAAVDLSIDININIKINTNIKITAIVVGSILELGFLLGIYKYTKKQSTKFHASGGLSITRKFIIAAVGICSPGGAVLLVFIACWIGHFLYPTVIS